MSVYKHECDIDDSYIDDIDETGIYYVKRSRSYELWYVDPETKEKSIIGWCIGEKDGKRYEEYAALMWKEFETIASDDISSVYDFCDAYEVH
jgi:hypothetical protein